MQQASILFTFLVLVMGAAWVALVELGVGADESAEAPVIVALAD